MKKKVLLIIICFLSIYGYSQVPTPNPCGQNRCVNETVVYGDVPIDPSATYSLSISPSTTSSIISSGTQLQVTFANPGAYTITVTKTIPGCPPITSTCNVVVNPLIIPTITTVSVCQGSSSVTLTSSVPGTFSGVGIIGNQFTPGVLVPGSYNVIFTANAGSCISTSPVTGINTITPGPIPPVIGSSN